MGEKLIVRYFYSPICPESFSTLDRLAETFKDYNDVYFESFNVIEDNIISDITWFKEEEALIQTITKDGTKPLLYAKLFINGEEVEGFPPSKKSMSEKLSKLNDTIDTDKYSIDYGSFSKDRIECDLKDFNITSYNQYTGEMCKVCTKYHPYLNENTYDIYKWEKYEKSKSDYINSKILSDEMIGFNAFYKNRPAGFIEAFKLDEAARLGFPVSNRESDAIMVTCLSICTEFNGYGLAKKLINELIRKASEKGFKSIEVLAFPDNHNWQPRTLYKKQGFINERVYENGLVLMKKELCE